VRVRPVLPDRLPPVVVRAAVGDDELVALERRHMRNAVYAARVDTQGVRFHATRPRRRLPCVPTKTPPSTSPAFERTSKRRRGYPSETHVKRGRRVVHGDKELLEKLGRRDPCPCGSGRCFQTLLPALRPL
jgi:hypothetical protein